MLGMHNAKHLRINFAFVQFFVLWSILIYTCIDFGNQSRVPLLEWIGFCRNTPYYLYYYSTYKLYVKNTLWVNVCVIAGTRSLHLVLPCSRSLCNDNSYNHLRHQYLCSCYSLHFCPTVIFTHRKKRKSGNEVLRFVYCSSVIHTSSCSFDCIVSALMVL